MKPKFNSGGGGDPQLEWVYLDSFDENLSIKSSIIIIIITTTLITEIIAFGSKTAAV